MDSILTKNEAVEDVIKNISRQNSEPECYAKHRLSTFNEYENLSMPSRVNHLWKYSDPAWFELEQNFVSTEKSNIVFEYDKNNEEKGIILAQINNIFDLKIDKSKIKDCFGKFVNEEKNKYAILNESTWIDGYIFFSPQNVKIQNPITVKITNNSTEKLQSKRILIILEENSEVTIINELFSSSEAQVENLNIVMEVFLAKGAKLTLLNTGLNNKNTTCHFYQRSLLDNSAKFTNLFVSFGGKIFKADIGSKLNSDLAEIKTFGIVLGDENQRFDSHTSIEHLAPNTLSGLDFRVALKDKAKSAYTGNLKIINSAIKCSAVQENRNLLLSSAAKAESIPELEILTNDVEKCSHGVTMGQVDKDQIFYLMSRGFSEKEAEKLIIEGFLEPTVSRIPDDNLREEVKSRIQEKLKSL